MAILTLVGGTVGGYISFAGAHRLLDAGLTGPGHIKKVIIALGRPIRWQLQQNGLPLLCVQGR